MAYLVVVLLSQLTAAAPAAAHADLVTTSPSNGQRLDAAPTEVTLRFTESVRLVDGGLDLLDAAGNAVSTPEPVADGSTVRWAMPAELPPGSYLVNWRVVSSDSHPVAGAFSFGVGVAPEAVAQTASSNDVPTGLTAARLGGYLGFTLIAGVTAFLLACWPQGRADPRLQGLFRAGIVVAAVSTVAGLLLQGPYAAGEPASRLLSQSLLAETAHTTFGVWTQLRLYVYLAMAAVLWHLGAFQLLLNRWIAAAGVVATAATFSATGHAAASGDLLDKVTDSTHVLAAGIWLGGLISLAATAKARPGQQGVPVLLAFSRLALWSVAALVVTGTVNALLRLNTFAQLWNSDYGQLLALKLVLVAAVLAAAALSRQQLSRREQPWQTVRLEAGSALAVLAVTAVLAATPPPSTSSQPSTATVPTESTSRTVEMNLGDGRSARLDVTGLSTTGSQLRLTIVDAAGAPMLVKSVGLKATLPASDIGPLDIPLTEKRDSWTGALTFPLPGVWTLTLTVEDEELTGLVTAGDVRIE